MPTDAKAKPKSNIDLPSIEQIRSERTRIKHRSAYQKALFGTIHMLALAAAAAVLFSTLLFPVLEITGSSMAPALESGDILVLLKSRQFKTGDICSFSWNNRTLVKRVIGLPGDWIEIDANGTVYRNGKALDEPYLQTKCLGECDISFPYQVPDHCLFVMGDQREHSIDSRNTVIGSVDFDRIIGKVLFRVWPFSKIGPVRGTDTGCDGGI